MKLHSDVTIQIAPVDICTILTELICKDYSLFEGFIVAEIDQRKDGNFEVALVQKPKPRVRVADKPKLVEAEPSEDVVA